MNVLLGLRNTQPPVLSVRMHRNSSTSQFALSNFALCSCFEGPSAGKCYFPKDSMMTMLFPVFKRESNVMSPKIILHCTFACLHRWETKTAHLSSPCSLDGRPQRNGGP